MTRAGIGEKTVPDHFTPVPAVLSFSDAS